jgi:hypothetical protein
MPSYYRYTIQGQHAADAAQAMLGPVGSSGLVVRVDTTANETHVIIAADAPPGPVHALPAGVRAEGVVADAELLRIS